MLLTRTRSLSLAAALPRQRPRRECCAHASGGAASAGVTRSEWTWKGHKIAFERRVGAGLEGPRSPMNIVVVHGFGSNYHHFSTFSERVAAAGHTVIIPDLLGFGSSDKPDDATYDPYTWSNLVADLVAEHIPGHVVLCGNSIGSQVTLMTAELLQERGLPVAGCFLMNCAGGMNQKGLYGDDLLLRLLSPLFLLVETVLKSRFARGVFDNFRSAENVRAVLKQQVYVNAGRVTDELVEHLMEPSNDPGALNVFRQVYIGEPGPRPETVASRLSCPIAVVWGDQDRWTPANGTVAGFFRKKAVDAPQQYVFADVKDCGHVPFDDRPDEVASELTRWLDGRIMPSCQ